MSVRPRHCERCRREIPAERLEVLPETRMCVECVRAVGGEFDLVISPENLGKAGSLKKNYGSFGVVRVRRR